jgi:hypothetical protein
LASLGLGTLGFASFANLTKYKPFFVIITAVMLYFSYSIIERNNSGKLTRVIFWISAVLSVLILYSPNILSLFY